VANGPGEAEGIERGEATLSSAKVNIKAPPRPPAAGGQQTSTAFHVAAIIGARPTHGG
jgi:hypothetical protein